MDLNEYLTSQRDVEDYAVAYDLTYPCAKRITCKDGFSLSVQASCGAYCTPRGNIGPWWKVEVGYPNAQPELIMSYAENVASPTDTVYCYVPIELVEQLIELHGGMKGAE